MPFAEKGHFQSAVEDAVLKGERPVIPEDTNPDYKSLIEHCWAQSPLERPDFEAIVQKLTAIKTKLEEQ